MFLITAIIPNFNKVFNNDYVMYINNLRCLYCYGHKTPCKCMYHLGATSWINPTLIELFMDNKDV